MKVKTVYIAETKATEYDCDTIEEAYATELEYELNEIAKEEWGEEKYLNSSFEDLSRFLIKHKESAKVIVGILTKCHGF